MAKVKVFVRATNADAAAYGRAMAYDIFALARSSAMLGKRSKALYQLEFLSVCHPTYIFIFPIIATHMGIMCFNVALKI